MSDSNNRSVPEHDAATDWSLRDRALNVAAEGITISDQLAPGRPLIYVNKGFERLTGYKASEVLGRNCRFLQGSDTDQKTTEAIRRALVEERECTVEILNYRKNGTKFWNRLSLTPVRNHRGTVTNYIGVQSDVTDRRNAEDKLRDANRHILAGLEAGARIQQALLPQLPPDITGVDIDWQFLPCDELAGDIFNVFRLDDRRVVMYLLDVVGHGVPAALLSVTLSHFLSPGNQSNVALGGGISSLGNPLEVVNLLNQQFPFNTKTGQFFTILYGVLDTAAKEFRYISAGHPPIVHVDSSGKPRLQKVSGYPVGIERYPGYKEQIIQLKIGERLIMYTDGMVEAVDRNGEAFGYERLMAKLGCLSETLGNLLPQVLQSVEEWSGGEGLDDDASILGLEIIGDTSTEDI